MKLNMVYGLPKFISQNGVCEGYVLGKNHQDTFNSRKTWRTKT